MVENRFKFFEKVRIATGNLAIVGELGAILGMAQREDGRWSYAVHVYGKETCYSCMEDQLVSIGEFDCRESFFNGESIRVSPKGEIL